MAACTPRLLEIGVNLALNIGHLLLDHLLEGAKLLKLLPVGGRVVVVRSFAVRAHLLSPAELEELPLHPLVLQQFHAVLLVEIN